MSAVRGHLNEAAEVLQQFISGNGPEKVSEAAEALAHCFKSGGQVISCGNGGSMADAIHFAEELTGKFRNDRPPFRAIAISDPGYLSCTANDYGYEQVFARFCEAHLNSNDVLLAISTSGHSKNILEAAKVAQKKGTKVIGLTGKSGGKLAALCDIEIRIPHEGFADRIQEMHIKVIHCMIGEVETLMGY
jgi:D-sedoheptulose 7-phosphate isomerase